VDVTADTGVNKPASDADQVTVTFLDTANNAIATTNTGGGVVNVGGGVPGFKQGAWANVADGKTLEWAWSNSLLPVFALDDAGRNNFLGTGSINLAPGESQQWVDVTVYDSINGPWTETEQLAPETSSLALLLPGLIPLGIVLRRRRKTRG
jgi:hypothetical protein